MYLIEMKGEAFWLTERGDFTPVRADAMKLTIEQAEAYYHSIPLPVEVVTV